MTLGSLARELLRAVALSVSLYLAYVAVRGSRMLVRPVTRPLVPESPGAPSTPADLGLAFESVDLRTTDGVRLAAWFIPADRPTATAVVVLHGFTGNRLPELAGFVPWLQRHHNVLQFDFRGHGASDGTVVTLGARERADIAAAVEYLRARGLDRIALFGVSMGAAAAILAAPELPVVAVVADAPYAQVAHPVASRMRDQGWPLPELGSRAIVAAAGVRARTSLVDPLGAVARIAPRALLVITPTADRLISWRQGLALFEAAHEPKELYVVEGAAHGDSYVADPAGYQNRVLDFLQRHLEAA